MRTAPAKGPHEERVLLVHILRNSPGLAATVVAPGVAGIVGGAIVTEQVFKMNGLGLLLIAAIRANDLLTVQILTCMLAVLIILFNLAADLLCGILDPRNRDRRYGSFA